MKKSLTFRHMEHSNAMELYVDQQLLKLEKFLSNEPTPVFLDIVLEADKRRSISRGELRLKTPHFDAFLHDEQPDMYDVIDNIIDMAYRNVLERKKELIDQRKTKDRFKGV